ncbi:MAG: DUF805 domain-containing protein [Azospirillum sp.]|nr:DUF805 domain-containing protein [Azospirillum sp.]
MSERENSSYVYPVSFSEAIKICLGKYATFTGRASRSEFWYFYLFYILVYIGACVIDAALGAPVLSTIVSLGLLLPVLAAQVRRLHDTGRSGWWILIVLTIIGGVVLLIWYCQKSSTLDNQHGDAPLLRVATA